MNKTFKTIWNAVRGAYVTVNETVCGASQKRGSVKLAVLTVAAAAALSAGDVVQAAPDYVTSKVGDFNLSRQDEGDALDLIASKILLDEQSGATDGTVQFTFSGADATSIQAVDGFSGFDKTNVGSISDIFSGAAGIHVRSTKADNNSFTLNNVNVTVSMQAGVSETELFGVWHDSGIVTVSDAATISVSNDATDIAMGYAFDSIHDNERPTPSSRQTTFTDTASISASSSVDGAWAAGIYMRANAVDKPVLTFKKDAEISANAAFGEAGGIILNYSDYGSNNSTDGAQGGSVVFEDTSALTVEASGKAAVGVLVDVGSLIVNGKADIKASGTENEYGIVIRGHGKATFNGETEVTAKNALVLTPEDKLDGLNWANGEIYNYGYQTSRHPVAEFKGTTTLNGALKQSSGTTINNTGTMTVNGDAMIAGTISGETGTLTLTTATVTGNVTQNAIYVKGDSVILADSGHMKAKRIEIQDGKFVDQAESDADHYLFGENGTMVIADSRLIEGALNLSHGTFEFAGGQVAVGDDQSAVTIAKLGLRNGDSGDTGGKFIFTKGDYSFDSLDISSSDGSITNNTIVSVQTLKSSGIVSIDGTGTLTVGKYQSEAEGDITLKSGTIQIKTLDLTNGKLTIDGTATLATSSGQIFTNALGEDGTAKDAGELKDNLIFAAGSTLDVTDAKYNLAYSDTASRLVANGTVHFTGTLVDDKGEEQTEVDIGNVTDGSVLDKTDIVAKPTESGGTVTVDKNVGGQTIIVGDASKLEIKADKNLTIIGTLDGSKELVSFTGDSEKSVNVAGSLTLGKTGTDTSGKLSATVNLTKETTGGLTVQDGKFNLDKVTAVNGKITVQAGYLTLGRLDVSTDDGKTQISVNEGAKVTVGELAAKAGEHIITGAVEVGKLAQDAANALIQIGTTGESGLKGALTIAEGGLKGLKFFLDPTWKDGMEVTDASSLRIAETNVDGQIVVGQNSYVSLGTTDDSAFVQLFKDGTLTWGGENGTLAAVYVAKPITIASTGSLVVDASLKTVPANDPAAGSVKFAADSVLVANVKNFKDGDTAITVDNGASITVAESSKAVVIAEAGQTFQLTSDDEVNKNYWNKAGDTLISANKLVSFNVGADGKITTEAEDAEDVFAGLMQGAALANAGAASDNEAVKSYAEALLSDTTGKKSNAQIAREFDAAMNPAGTLGVFTTAKDRSTELRDAVRAHGGNGTANGLWAQVTGGKTKLKGISTGAQDLDLDTDAYGLAVGGEAAVQNITLGAAFMGGSGKTENDSVAGKDDFNYYGISFYAKTQVQGIDLEGDVSAAWLKSDLTVGGAADVDTDTTAAVYSLGIQAKKSFNLGVDVTPFIGMDVYHIKSDGFTTNHGVSIEDANATIVEFPIGTEVKKAFQTSSGFSVAPSFSLAVVPTVGSKDIDSKVRFAGAESTYNFTFADDVKVRSQLGIEAQKDNFTLGLAAGYDWGNEERSAASVQFRAKYAF
jgi:outer membrane autotransporter barrel domain protein